MKNMTKSEGYDILEQFIRIRAELQGQELTDVEAKEDMDKLYWAEHFLRYIIEDYLADES